MLALLQTALQRAGIAQLHYDQPQTPLANGEFLLLVQFPSAMRTMAFYNYLAEADTYLVDFTALNNCPSEGFKVPKAKLQAFIEEFVLPSSKLPAFGIAVTNSWTRERTETLLTLADPQAISKKFFLCIDSDEVYSWLHRHFINCYALNGLCFNEAGLEGAAWGAAQYYTAYSLSILNYEAIVMGKMPSEDEEDEDGYEDEEDEYNDYDILQMHFVVSYCYVPTVFGKQGLVRPLEHPNAALLAEDMPVDLAMALVDLPLTSLLSIDQLIEKIIEDEAAEDYLVALNYMITEDQFLAIAPRLLTSSNVDVVAQVTNWQAEILDSKNE